MTKTSSAYSFLEPPTQPGDLGMLGSYRILGELGRGGMGYVFRAEDTVLERPVALKVMNKRIASTPNSRDRFLQEARAMAAVHHDNVVVIFEVGTHEGTPFMAMEMLRGETLEAINARKETRDYERVIDYARQISRGLAAAHAKGIVHRDIKPANIWVEEGSGRIKILDFGLALAQSPGDDPSGVGAVCGTPGYLTPEQARSDPLDDRSDLYSLGVVLYEMCTGQLPMAQPAIAEQLVALLTGTPKPLRELNPEIPQPLADLIHQLLAREPADRPANALALEKLLIKVAHECEAKSEVALSLGKLQESLKLVVNQKDEVELTAPAPVEKPDLPAFDPLPAPAPAAAGFPSATAPLPGSLPQPAAAAPGARAKTPVKTQSPPLSPLVWAGGGVLATLLLVLAIAWMIIPRQRGNTVSAPLAAPSPPQTAIPPPPSSPPPTTPAAPPNQPAPKAAPPQGPSPAEQKARAAKRQQTQAAERKRQADADALLNPPSPATNVLSTTPADEQPPAMESPAPEPSESPAPESSPVEKQPPLQRVGLRTSGGLGADSTVRAESDIARGHEATLFVQRKKNGEDRQHIHLRFDLQTINRDAVRRAALRLFFATPQRFSNTQLDLYGYAAPQAELWEEDEARKRSITWGNSISAQGLDSLPLLATFEHPMQQASDQTEMTFSSEELAEFIRKSTGKSVSFVVAGGNDLGTAIRFYSKEGNENAAPVLLLELSSDE